MFPLEKVTTQHFGETNELKSFLSEVTTNTLSCCFRKLGIKHISSVSEKLFLARFTLHPSGSLASEKDLLNPSTQLSIKIVPVLRLVSELVLSAFISQIILLKIAQSFNRC